MKYIQSIIRWLTQSRVDDSNPAMEVEYQNPGGDRLFYAILSAIFLVLAFWFYGGKNARLLGPPLGEVNGQDFRQILRASWEISRHENIYQHAIAYAEAPTFYEFLTWSASPYPYSPILAVLALPLLQFDERSALFFWTILSWFFLIVTGIVIVRGILEDKNWFKLLVVLLFFAMYGPVHLDLTLGQLDILILFLLSLAFYLYRRQSLYAGVLLGCAISSKLLLAPMLAYFLWKKDWKTSAITVATVGVLTAFGFSVAGWRQLVDFLRVNYLWSVTGMLSYPLNQSINGLGLRLFTENPYIEPLVHLPPMLTISRALGIVTAIILWLMIVSRRDNRRSVEGFLEYGFTLSTMLFLSPLVDDIHYVWLLLPISGLLAILSWDLSDRRRILLAVATLLCILLLAHPDMHVAVYYGWENLVHRDVLVSGRYVLLTGAYLYALIALEACLVLTFRHLRKRIASISV